MTNLLKTIFIFTLILLTHFQMNQSTYATPTTYNNTCYYNHKQQFQPVYEMNLPYVPVIPELYETLHHLSKDLSNAFITSPGTTTASFMLTTLFLYFYLKLLTESKPISHEFLIHHSESMRGA